MYSGGRVTSKLIQALFFTAINTLKKDSMICVTHTYLRPGLKLEI